mgnify:CR=1 FL=1
MVFFRAFELIATKIPVAFDLEHDGYFYVNAFMMRWLRSLSDVLLAGLESAVAGVLSGGAELLLNLEQAVVLGDTLATSRSTGLDLAGVLCHSQVGDGGVRGLAGTVGNHGGEAVLGGQLDGVEGLGDGADLVELDQQGVGGAELDALSQTCRVGDQQVVADELQTIAELGGDGSPVFPAFFLERILNGRRSGTR